MPVAFQIRAGCVEEPPVPLPAWSLHRVWIQPSFLRQLEDTATRYNGKQDKIKNEKRKKKKK